MVGRRDLIRLIAMVGVGSSNALASGFSAAQIEAVMVFRVAGFIRWPHEFPSDFRLGVIGATDREVPLRRLAERHELHDATVRVQRLSTSGPWRDVDLLYVAPEEAAKVSEIARALERQPVLVVTHVPGGARLGAAVNFYEEDGKIRFEINPQSLKRRGLTASYKLLSLARIVEDP